MGLTNAELGLVLTTVAGSATALGAAVVFSERLVQLASKPFLAGALGLSSGVMLYVSFVEIFVKSLDGFADSSAFGDSDAYLMATAALFGGMGFMSGLDALVHWLDPNRSAHHASDPRKHMVRASGVLFCAVSSRSSLACVLTCRVDGVGCRPYAVAATLSPRRWRTSCTTLYGGVLRSRERRHRRDA
jgi:zinc transporter ZupT